MNEVGGRLAWRAGAVAATVAWVVSVVLAAPTSYLLDSSELVATAWSGAISHPPGHPVFSAAIYPFLLLPVGTIAFRAHVACATFGALAVGLLPLAAHALGFVRTARGAAAAALVACSIGLTHAFVFQSVRAEVYSLHALLAALAVTLLCRLRLEADVRLVVSAAVVLGLALGNHHYLTIFLLPVVAVAAWFGVHRGTRLRALAWSAAAGGACGAAYLSLLARGATQPAMGWGWPRSLADLYWLASAQAFQKTAGKALQMDVAAGVQNAALVFVEQLSPVGALLAVAGATLWLLRRSAAVVLVTGGIVLNALTQVLFDFDPLNPDVLGYFMVGLWLSALLALGALAILEEARQAPLSPALAALVLCALIATNLAGPRHFDLSDYWDSDVLRDHQLEALAPSAVLATAYFETAFNVWYGLGPEDRRPDVRHEHVAFSTYPYYSPVVRARAERERSTAVWARDPRSLLALCADGRAVYWEPELVFDDSLVPVSELDGNRWRLLCGAAPRAGLATLDRTFAALEDQTDTQTRRNVVWSVFNLARSACAVRREPECAALSLRLEALTGEPLSSFTGSGP